MRWAWKYTTHRSVSVNNEFYWINEHKIKLTQNMEKSIQIET